MKEVKDKSEESGVHAVIAPKSAAKDAPYEKGSKPTGRQLDSHPGVDPKGAEEHFSVMRKVDMKEHHAQTLANMGMTPHAEQKEKLKIHERHAYKKQSHAVSPKGIIDSVVGSGIRAGRVPNSAHPADFPVEHEMEMHSRPSVRKASEAPVRIVRPDMDGEYDSSKGVAHIDKNSNYGKKA